MPSDSFSELKAEIGHVLFIDIVGYSKLLINEQSEVLRDLNEMVRHLPQVEAAEQAGKLIRLPSGDGMALVFRDDLEAPALCALEISRVVKASPAIQLRMGIHSGPINEISDVNERINIAGGGINVAQRVMDCGDAGHILLSKRVADDLAQYRHWQPLLHELGECEVKHGVRISVVNLYTEELGNAELPAKFKSAGVAAAPAPSKLSRKHLVLLSGVAAALLVGFLIFSLSRKSGSSTSASEPARGAISVAAPQKSIAVLPFMNMSGNAGDEYLSDGMTEELLSSLTKVKELRVPGRSSCFAFKGMYEEDIFRKVGQQLHVNAVLEGSVRKAGEKLRITAQLINVADGYHLWSETYDRDMSDILAVETDVAQRVVQALKVQLGVEGARALAKKPTENPEAHRLYLLGRYHFDKFTRAGWTSALRCFEQAIQLDPTYALAYCGLADTYATAGGQLMPGKEAWAKEREFAEKALALDPNLAEAHLSMATALFSLLDPHASEKELDRAVELSPKLLFIYDQYGWTFAEMGRFDEAIAAEKKAVEFDPLNPFTNTELGFLLYWARRYDEAIVQIRKTLELDPNNAWAYSVLGWCSIWKGNEAEAIAAFQKATTLDDLPWYIGSLGYAHAVAGDRAKAEQILGKLDELAKQHYVSPANRAAVYLGLGEKEKALDWLEKAWDDRDPIFWWNQDQLYDSVRHEPRFEALLKKISLDR